LEPKSPLVFVLNEGKGKPIKNDNKKAKNYKYKGAKDKTDQNKLVSVSSDSFGADLDASSVRSSPNVSVLFHVRPAVRIWISCCHVYIGDAEQ
jgi:hypothetical protein